jgi:16S rRNA (cytosine967-C5)-methyltransferase
VSAARRAPARGRSARAGKSHANTATATARSLALQALARIERDGAYANLLVPQLLARSGLRDADRHFVTELVYGTTRMRRACDALVDRFVLSEPEDDVRRVLRLGAFQLAFAGVAPHAAVGETVELAPRRARGFVNAVLRKVATTPMQWPDDARRLSYPDWIADRLVAELGRDDAMAAMERMNVPPRVTERSDGYVQDLASQWVAALVPAAPGDTVVDLCAAPGGKATAIAAAGAHVVAVELQPNRARLVAANAHRLGADVHTVVADGTAAPLAGGCADHVLVDAPCSGLGALRRRPDARWRVTAADLTGLAALQRRLLAEAARLVRPGGTLTYSVCTLTAEESIHLPVPDGLTVVGTPLPAPWRPFGHGHRLLPHDADTDGMVVVRFRRANMTA